MSKHEHTISFLSTHNIKYELSSDGFLTFQYDDVLFIVSEETDNSNVVCMAMDCTQYDYLLLCEVCNQLNKISPMKCRVISDTNLPICEYHFFPEEFDYEKYFTVILMSLKSTAEAFFAKLLEHERR